jgi:hypothetical protein
MFSVGNIGDREGCHHRLCFAFGKELPQFFKRGARQRLKRTEMPQQRVLCQPTIADAPRRITQMTRNVPAFREYFEGRFRAEKYGVPYFLTESEAKQSGPPERGRRSKSAQRSRILNGGHRREALGGGRLSRRRHSCGRGRPWVRRVFGASQTS